MVNQHTIVLIMSDGLDTGDASVLEYEMEQIHRAGARDLAQSLLATKTTGAGARHERALPRNLFASAHNWPVCRLSERPRALGARVRLKAV